MASVLTSSPFTAPLAPPLPVVVLLAMSNLPSNFASCPLLIHTNLPLCPLKRDRTPALPRSLRFDPVARATSSPLSSAAPSFVDGPETPRTMPGPAEIAGSATMIPRPKGAQLTVKSCDCIPKKDLESLKKRVKTLVSEMLNIAIPYTQQLPENLEKIEAQLVQEFPFLRQYECQWPLQVLITARLKHFASQKVTRAARKIVEAAEAATATPGRSSSRV